MHVKLKQYGCLFRTSWNKHPSTYFQFRLKGGTLIGRNRGGAYDSPVLVVEALKVKK